MTPALLGLLAAYLIGSIPSAYIAGRLLEGIDLRSHGSGNLGATNVLRTLGWPAAVVVLVADAAKGWVAAFWLQRLTGASPAEWWAIAYGVAAILGHVRPAFLLWRGGGKGVATAAGVFLALAPLPLIVGFVLFAVVLAATRLMSLASLCGAALLPLAMALTYGVHDPLFTVTIGVAAFVFWTHRSNIDRLRRGIEPRLGRKKPV